MTQIRLERQLSNQPSQHALSSMEIQDGYATATAEVDTTFNPSLAWRNGHLQTILGPYILKPKKKLPATVYRAPLPNGDHTFVYDSLPQSIGVTQRHADQAVILLHGLGGSHASGYIARISRLLLESGYRVVRLDLPGCGPSITLTELPAHAGCSQELRHIMQWCQDQLAIKKWKIAGFSLGGNITLKLLAELAKEADGRPWAPVRPMSIQIEQALVVAPPIDLKYCCEMIEKGMSRVYSMHFARILRGLAQQRTQVWPKWAERSKVPHARIRTIRQFDEQYTAPIAGFSSADEYYARCSTHQLVSSIVTPLHVLLDRHDPVVAPSIFDKAPWSSSTHITYTQHGGHLGYFQRDANRKLYCWMDQWVVQRLVD